MPAGDTRLIIIVLAALALVLCGLAWAVPEVRTEAMSAVGGIVTGFMALARGGADAGGK